MTAPAVVPLRRLQGEVALVTGAARGLGRAIAERLHAEGALVAYWDVDGDRLAELSAGDGFEGLVDTVDITDSTAVTAGVARIRDQLGPVGVLVNNAGISAPCDPQDVTDESWRTMMAVNTDAAFWCVRACLPGMRAARRGKIVNISSIAALHGRPATHPAYATSKAALIGMTATLSHNLGPDGITVNAVCPGIIRTEIHESYTDEQLAVFFSDIPLVPAGRAGERGLPRDIAAAVAFLASPDADYITGQYLEVNGGARP
ncbi:SDR family oxidoreductase [Nakamurella sp. YIM 132087]|uniref:SDR family oxidoreductase n=1 Tax=Nakamurella alba TaxID=2665158 RepID=A0A7K1FSP9_9ACTN|nr:SDR family NAD(P)-dependent oxidoreductase [Nakamurella alba]MTD17100.1 SDR family oxidoreductase [Nakamurella alba]